MIIWRIRKLADQLRSGEFSARQELPYLVAAVLWASVTFVFADWSRPWDRDDFETSVDSVTTLINGLISAIGIYGCYKANGGSTGPHLATRVCSLGVVLFVRFLAYTVLALIVWVFAATRLPPLLAPSYEGFDVLSVLLVFLYWRQLRHHIASIAITH